MQGITDEELYALPDDDELAFVKYEQIARDNLNRILISAEEYRDQCGDAEHDYMVDVLGAAKAFGIAELSKWQLPESRSNDFMETVKEFRTAAMHEATKLRIAGFRKTKRYSVAFDPPTKQKLRHHLNQMREIVDGSADTPEKKAALYARIAELSEEIDRDRARYEHLTALSIQVAATAGAVWEKLAPITRTIEVIFGDSKKKENEQPRLPAPHSRKQIEGPVAKGKPKSRGLGTLDDEIPF
jgi:hypothetical protein